MGLPRWCSLKNPPANAGDAGSTPGSGRSPGVGNGNLLLLCSCLKNSMMLQRVEDDWGTGHDKPTL